MIISMEKPNVNQNPMPEFDIIPHPLRAIGRAVGWLVTKQQLASHGDHFVGSLGADEMLLVEDVSGSGVVTNPDGWTVEQGSGDQR